MKIDDIKDYFNCFANILQRKNIVKQTMHLQCNLAVYLHI